MSHDLMTMLQLIPWWCWLALIVTVFAAIYAAHWMSVRESRRKAVPPIVQGTNRIQRSDDDDWQRIRVFRWWGHVWVWVPLDACTGLTDRTVDEGDAADAIASLWRGRAAGEPTRHDLFGGWRVFHILRGGRR